MLGTKDAPSLLVDVLQERTPTEFDFWVVNGAWAGVFYNGHVTILGCPSGDYSDLGLTEILSDNQDRLRGHHNDVFNNFNNPDYVAPKPKKVKLPADWDDDIPF